jgi:hypothetical protein
MVHVLSIWLLVAGFFGAGLFNAIGNPGTQSDFARWGYPRWWNVFTGGLEIMSGVLIALPVSRVVGLALGAVIIAAAVLTVLRHRDFSHLVPLSVFVALSKFASYAVSRSRDAHLPRTSRRNGGSWTTCIGNLIEGAVLRATLENRETCPSFHAHNIFHELFSYIPSLCRRLLALLESICCNK